VVVQSGQMAPAAATAADFVVNSERRYWIHVALDRFTGEIVGKELERIDE